MKRMSAKSVFAVALLTVSFAMSACHDGHPDRGDRSPRGHDHMEMSDHDHHENEHN
jgi:hypothetical protein